MLDPGSISMETNVGSWMRHRNNTSAPQSGFTADADSSLGSPSSSLSIGSAAVVYSSTTSSSINADQTPHSSSSSSNGGDSSIHSNSVRRQSSASWGSSYAGGGDGTTISPSHYKFRNQHAYSSAAGRKTSSGDRRKYNGLLLIAGLFLLVAPWIRHMQTYCLIRSLQSELEALQTKQSLLQKEIKNQITTLKKIKAETSEYKTHNDNLLGQLKMHGDEFEDFDSSSYILAEELENNYLQRVDELEHEIQRASGRKLVYHGHGLLGSSAPMRAIITLASDVLPPEMTAADGKAVPRTLVLEMAPTHTYSHAIAYFMDMVHSRRLFDGLTFMRTATGSVLYTVPWEYQTRQFRKGGSMDHFEISKTNFEAGSTLLDRMAVKEHPQEPTDYPVGKYSGMLFCSFVCDCVNSDTSILIEKV